MSYSESLAIGQRDSAYYAVVSVNEDALKEALEDSSVTGLEEGSEIFSALINKYHAIPRYEEIHGGRNNVTKRSWYDNGNQEEERHFANGKLHDLPDGTAADQRWYHNGIQEAKHHYSKGRLEDAENGTAACQRWDRNGNRNHLEYCTKGKRTELVLDKDRLKNEHTKLVNKVPEDLITEPCNVPLYLIAAP